MSAPAVVRQASVVAVMLMLVLAAACGRSSGPSAAPSRMAPVPVPVPTVVTGTGAATTSSLVVGSDAASAEDGAQGTVARRAPLATGTLPPGSEAEDVAGHSAKDDTDYYDSTIKLLCLIALSGNWWSP